MAVLGTGMEQHKAHSWEGRRSERELSEDLEQQSLSSVQSVTARPVLALLLHLTAQRLPRTAPCPAPALVPPPLPIRLSNPDRTSQGSIINQFLVTRGRQSILKAIFLTKLGSVHSYFLSCTWHWGKQPPLHKPVTLFASGTLQSN